MILIYWLNIFVLFGSFITAIFLFFQLFALDSLAYKLGTFTRGVFKIVLIIVCVGQLHAIEGDAIEEIHLHTFLRDFGQFGFLVFANLYLFFNRGKQ